MNEKLPTPNIAERAVPDDRELFSYDGTRMWLRADLPTKRWEHGKGVVDGPPLTRAQAKAQALSEISLFYDWCSLRCRKVWLAYDPHATDEEGMTGMWVSAAKGSSGAMPWWEVEETANG